MRRLLQAIGELRAPLRQVVVGAVVLGVLGGVVGFVLGWIANPATSWFAVLEVGAPAAGAGALLGLVVGALFAGRSGSRPDAHSQRRTRRV